MKRVNRVMDLLEALRAQGATTVEALASSLGVSRRTLLRDLAVLRERGWDVRGETGPGGGVRLEFDRGVTAVHLSVEEVAALWLASRLTTSIAQVPWSRAARSALDKAFASLPSARRKTLRALVRRIVIGRPATERVRATLSDPPTQLLVAFEAAVSGNWLLRIDYRDRHGKSSQRVVEPHGLLVEAPAWYLLTRDTASGEARMFRADRVLRATPLVGRSFVPQLDMLHEQAKQQRKAAAEH